MPAILTFVKSRTPWVILASVELLLATLIVVRPFVSPLNYRPPLGRNGVPISAVNFGPGQRVPHQELAVGTAPVVPEAGSTDTVKMILDRVNHLETILSSSLFSLLISTTLAVGGGAYTIKDKRIPISGLTVFVGANLVYVLLSAHYYFMLTHFYSSMIFLIDQNGLAGIKDLNLLWIEFQSPTPSSGSWIPQIAYLIQATLAPLFFGMLTILGVWGVFLRDGQAGAPAALMAKHKVQLAPPPNSGDGKPIDLFILADADAGNAPQQALPFAVVAAAIAFHILIWASMIWSPFWDFFMALHGWVRTL